MRQDLSKWSHALVALVVALATLGVTLAVTQTDDGHGHKTTQVTVHTANGKTVVATPAAVAAAGGSGAERGLNGDGNAATQRSSDRANPDGPVVKGPPPLAAPRQAGCLTRSNTANYSYRNGTRPSIGVLHLTVSPNVPGWGDVNGVDAFLNRPSTSASANYIIDREGHCVLAVAETLKAWAQANYNSATACSIEVINTGNESTYAGTAGLDKLARVVHDCAHRWGIPLQEAQVSGGRVLRAGFVSHFQLGALGGGHVDIHNFGRGCLNAGSGAPTLLCVDLVLAKARALDGRPVSAGQASRCRELNSLRRKSAGYHRRYHLKAVGPLSAREKRRAAAILAGERKAGVVCRVGAPGKRGTVTRR